MCELFRCCPIGLDQEGEVVCTQKGDQATVSYIPPAGLEDATPVIGVLETLLTASNVNNISVLVMVESPAFGKEGLEDLSRLDR